MNSEIYKVLVEFENKSAEAMREAESSAFMSTKWFQARREADTWDKAKQMLEQVLHNQSK